MNSFLKLIYLGLLAVAIIISLGMLVPSFVRLQKTGARMDSLQRVLDQKKSECLEKNRLQNDIDAHAAKAVEKVAREKYNLCRPGEVIYTYDSEPFKAKQEESTK